MRYLDVIECDNGWVVKQSEEGDSGIPVTTRQRVCTDKSQLVAEIESFAEKVPNNKDTKEFLTETGSAGFLDRIDLDSLPVGSDIEDTIEPIG